jgi:hypothetical protein
MVVASSFDEESYVEKRRSPRFNIRLPAHIVRAGANAIAQDGETVNLSAAGVLFSDPGVPVEIGQTVEYYIQFPATNGSGGAKIHCLGKIVRRDEQNNAIAATLERYEFVR